MPFSSEGIQPGIGMAMSGGGYRATLFHLGSLWRLNEIGYLLKLDRVSSVSGGSITAGALAVRWKRLSFAGEVATNFNDEIVDPLRRLCSITVDEPSVLTHIFLPWKKVSGMVEKAYRDKLLGDITLQSLPDRPRFVFNSTNFATGVDFRFSKPYAGDYRIGLIKQPTFRVSQAVMASSAFPPVLSPLEVKTDPASFTKTQGADLYNQVQYRERLILTDGGVYDNLGLETVVKRYDTILASDAGAPFGVKPTISTLWLKQSLHAVDIAVNQGRALRKRSLIAGYKSGRKGTYWGISTEIENYGVPDALPCTAEKRKDLASLRTRLNRFSEQEQCELINWGYALADAAFRRYVVSGPTPAAKWPYPDYPLG